jgi:hypothetical protein
MQTIKLSQWDKKEEVVAHTEQYVRMVDVDQKLRSAVDALRARRDTLSTGQIGGKNQKSYWVTV